MKKKKKVKKDKVKKSRIIVALAILVVLSVGVGFIINQSIPKYMNNVTNAASATCSKGFYYSFFNCLFGNCCRICNKGQFVKHVQITLRQKLQELRVQVSVTFVRLVHINQVTVVNHVLLLLLQMLELHQ